MSNFAGENGAWAEGREADYAAVGLEIMDLLLKMMDFVLK